ncbi:protein adenylyltransferase SelO [Halorhodospira halophila]|uniref:protein adenylyltransferase SelO n=1 Tax=Halorhodospira halophila TaxID=1053 RepID=UPI001914A945
MRPPLSEIDSLPWEATYAALPDRFHARLGPTPVARPQWVRLNRPLARQLGLDPQSLAGEAGLAVFAGNRVPAGADPVAQAYAGHQFGHFVPQLGDGRALLLGELIDVDGVRRDIQLKGAGPTPFSRGGDGRAPIGPVVREYLASEAMAALGIPTTRTLAAVATGETVWRHSPEPGGVLTRVASSHVRVGTFEYFARRGDQAAVRRLADYVLVRHYPHCTWAPQPYQALLEAVATATAELIAGWMHVGFIHGVMNTDNLSVAGETIDYGPFGFLDAFDPGTVYSSIDHFGRYAFDQQPAIGEWNLARLAEALLLLLDDDPDSALDRAREILSRYRPHFEAVHRAGLRAKIGLAEARPGDDDLVHDLLRRMAAEGADWTLTFRRLGELDGTDARGDDGFRQGFRDPQAADAWLSAWRARLMAERRSDAERRAAMRAVNPAFVLRNHLAQWAVDAATERLDFAPMERLLGVLADPWSDQPEHADLARPPEMGQAVVRTFCGT